MPPSASASPAWDANSASAAVVTREGITKVVAGSDHLALRDEGGHLAGAIFATARGLEELVVAGGSLRYRLELPSGWHLHQPDRRDELVELRDGRGQPQLRLLARWAFDEVGERHRLVVRIDGDGVIIEAPGDRGALLIDPEWLDAGMPSDDRSGAMVTTLRDGRVLLVGGGGILGNATTADRFDPATRTFAALPSAYYGRRMGTATLLGDGRVLIVGGGPVPDGSPAVDLPLEIFDPTTDQFEVLAGAMFPGVGHTATRLAGGAHDGEVLIAGGFSSVTASEGVPMAGLFLFDPETNSIASAGAMVEARGSHRAVLLPSGKVLFVGGWSQTSPLASVERYDPTTQTSEGIVGSLPSPRHAPTALLLPHLGSEGQLLVAGGFEALLDGALSDAWLYDLATHETIAVGSLVAARGGIYGALLQNGDALLLAGGDGLLGSSAPSHAERFDATLGTLVPLPAPPGGFGVTTGTGVMSGEHLVLGGDLGPLVFAAEDHRTIDVTATMTTPMSEPSVTLLSTNLVLVTEGSAAAELFDPITRTFEALPSGPPGIGRWHRATTLLDGRVLFTGGLVEFGVATSAAVLFDPATKLFTPTTAMPYACAAHLETLLPDGRVLVAGGVPIEEPSPGLLQMAIFDPVEDQFGPSISSSAGFAFGQAMTLADGSVWLWNGLGPLAALSSPPFKIDPTAGTLTEISEVFGGAEALAGVRLRDGRLFYTDGVGARLLDVTGTQADVDLPGPWSSATPTRTPAVVALPSARVLVVDADAPELRLGDPMARTMTLLPEPAAGRYAHAVTLLPDGGVLLAGAIADGPPSAQVSIWYENPPRLEWRPSLGPPPGPFSVGEPRALAGAGLFGVAEGTSATKMAPANAPAGFFLFDDGGIIAGDVLSSSDTQLAWRPSTSHFSGPGIFFASTMGLLSGRRGVFTRSDLGVPCHGHAACESGHCVDGSCCEGPCDGTCEECSAEGACGPAAAGTEDAACPIEPLVTCGLNGTCDGAGQCAHHPDETLCDEERICFDGKCVAQACDGDHTIISAAEPRDCTPYRCSRETDACLQQCASNLGCVTGFVCDATGRCTAPVDGADTIGCVACAIGRGGPDGGAWPWPVGLALALCRRRWTVRRTLRGLSTAPSSCHSPRLPMARSLRGRDHEPRA